MIVEDDLKSYTKSRNDKCRRKIKCGIRVHNHCRSGVPLFFDLNGALQNEKSNRYGYAYKIPICIEGRIISVAHRSNRAIVSPGNHTKEDTSRYYGPNDNNSNPDYPTIRTIKNEDTLTLIKISSTDRKEKIMERKKYNKKSINNERKNKYTLLFCQTD